jgi:hypothetical protein
VIEKDVQGDQEGMEGKSKWNFESVVFVARKKYRKRKRKRQAPFIDISRAAQSLQ